MSDAVVVKRKTVAGTVTTTTKRSGMDDDTDVSNYGDEIRVEMTDGKRYNRTVTVVEPAEMITWDVVVSLEMLYQKTVYFKNATEDEYKELVADLSEEIDEKVHAWEEAGRAPSSYAAEPGVGMDETTGRFAGSVTITARWSNGSAGQTGDANVVFFKYQYWDVGYGKFTRIAQGRGRKELEKFLWGCGQTAESVSISYDPTTQMWHASFTERNEGR